jgi:hypothetical protein
MPTSAHATLNREGAPSIGPTLVLCKRTAGGGSGGTEPSLDRGQAVRIDLSNLFSAQAEDDGIAISSVTSVEADLADGRVVHGVVLYGRGFPYAVWWVYHPGKVSVTLVFRNAAGNVVARVSERWAPPVNPLTHPVLLTPSAVQCDTGPRTAPPSQLVRVRQVMGRIKVWTYVQFTYPKESGRTNLNFCEMTGVVGDATRYQNNPVVLRQGQLVRALEQLDQTSTVSGVAARGVASVTAVLADGRSYQGIFVNGRGFPYQVWLVSYPTKYAATLVFRDGGGHQLAVLHAHANVWPVT